MNYPDSLALEGASRPSPRRLWLRQTWNVFLFEIRKILAGKRWMIVSLLAAALPLLLLMRVVIWLVNPGVMGLVPLSEVGVVFAAIFQSYGLRLAIFF
ncbi:MAG: hypothetical protein R3284_11745 [Rubricoccaceae bacterium]|nr:hypothetical protein [Rubricoccaceae bacterium]